MKGKFRDATERHDIYTRVTNKIVASLEQGVRPWHQPWNAGNLEGDSRNFRRPSRRSTGRLLDALGKAAERFVHVLQCLGFRTLRA